MQQAPQQMQQAPQQTPPWAAAPQKKKRTGKTLLIILAILLGLGLLGVGGYFLYDYLNPQKTTTETTDDKDEEEEADSKKKVDPDDEEEDADEAEAEETLSDDELASKKAAEYSTDGYPKAKELEWYTQGVMRYGVPREVKGYSNMHFVEGGWKGLIYYDPTNSFTAEVMEFVNMNISGTPENAKIQVTTYGIYDVNEDEGYESRDKTPSTYKGSWNNGLLNANGAGNIHLMTFWEQDGHQYAVGTYDSPDGIPANIALMR